MHAVRVALPSSGLMQAGAFEVAGSGQTARCTAEGKGDGGREERRDQCAAGRRRTCFSVISRRPFHSSAWAFFFAFVRPPMRRGVRGGAARGGGPRGGRRRGHVWRASGLNLRALGRRWG